MEFNKHSVKFQIKFKFRSRTLHLKAYVKYQCFKFCFSQLWSIMICRLILSCAAKHQLFKKRKYEHDMCAYHYNSSSVKTNNLQNLEEVATGFYISKITYLKCWISKLFYLLYESLNTLMSKVKDEISCFGKLLFNH